MNSAPAIHELGPAILNIAAASGSTNPVTFFGNSSSFSAAVTSAGSAAIEELELNLSPRLQIEMIEHLIGMIGSKENPIDQIIFTTHSHYFCHRVDLVSLYEVTIDELGRTSAIKKDKHRTKDYFEMNYL